VALFSQCPVAKQLLETSADIKRKWAFAVEWLNEELERGRGPYHGSGQFSYSNWSPPAQSNETANGYFLERSHSARLTLQKACELLPDEVGSRGVNAKLDFFDAWHIVKYAANLPYCTN
jgi:ubiquitin carboxyl-terminal hydrolase 9/24